HSADPLAQAETRDDPAQDPQRGPTDDLEPAQLPVVPHASSSFKIRTSGIKLTRHLTPAQPFPRVTAGSQNGRRTGRSDTPSTQPLADPGPGGADRDRPLLRGRPGHAACGASHGSGVGSVS